MCVFYTEHLLQLTPARICRRRYAQRKQEARLYSACVAAILLPIGMFVVAWTSTPSIPWIVPVMGLTVSTIPGPILVIPEYCIHVRSGVHGRGGGDFPSCISLSCGLVRAVIRAEVDSSNRRRF